MGGRPEFHLSRAGYPVSCGCAPRCSVQPSLTDIRSVVSRVATDLKLHYAINTKPENEHHAREILNRTRVWLNCFNLDRSTGSQYGQRPIIDNNDYVANHTEFWWNSSPYNMDGFDVHTCCYNAELKVMGEFRMRIYSNPNHPTGLNKVRFAWIEHFGRRTSD